MSNTWDMATRTARRRFWLCIFPTIVLVTFVTAMIAFELALTLPQTIRNVDRIERLGI
jgi:hypothetical protein